MKNILNKLTSPSSMCYFYIILLFTSIFIDPGSPKIFPLITITTTLISITILWELKKEINSKLSIYYLDFFIISFIIIKLVLSLGHLVFPEFIEVLISSFFGIIMGTLQLIYSFLLIKISSKKIKHLWLYGYLLFGSSIFLIFGPHMEIIFVMSIGSIYVLSEAFYELGEIVTPRNSKV